MVLSKKSVLIVLSLTFLLLLVPFVGMQLSKEVNWTLSDFIIGGIVLFAFGIIVAYALQNIKRRLIRLLVVGIILFILLLLWAELAVGVFGTPFAGS